MLSPRKEIADMGAFEILACPQCWTPLATNLNSKNCSECGSSIYIKDDVVVAQPLTQISNFDNVFKVMRSGNRELATWDIFYRSQIEYVASLLRPGLIVMDVGCGPVLPYKKNGAIVLGVDASFESIRANEDVDIRIFASGAALPTVSACVDLIICFYSIHHMTGNTVQENRIIVRKVFQEFARVLRPGGRLVVFDLDPCWPFGAIERTVWNRAKKRIGPALDMFFWQATELSELGAEVFNGAQNSICTFKGRAFRMFPPVFSVPALRIPRALYPFHICAYEWLAPEPNK